MAKKAKKSTKKRSAKGKKKSVRKKSPVKRKKTVPKGRKKSKTQKRGPQPKPSRRLPKLPDEPIGKVTHYFSKARAAAVLIERSGIRVGDTLFFKGHTTQFKQKILSLQVNREVVPQASEGEEVGIGVRSKVREHDLVYKLG